VLIINTVTLSTMFRVLSKVYIPWKRLAGGSILGAIALGVLQALGGLLFTSTSNPLLQSFVVIIGLLLWLNVSSAIILIAASWIAIGMADHDIPAELLTEQQIQTRHETEVTNARRIIAQDHINELTRAYANAGFIRRWFIKRRIRKARADFKAEFAVSAE
jgi:membrane protein